MPEETNALLRIRWSLGATESIVQRLAITPEQIVQLHAVSPVTDIQVSRADRQKLEDLFGDYLSAGDKGPAEKALVAAVGEIDAHYFAATMQHISGLAAQVRQIFSEEQWAGLAKRFGNPGAGARGPR